MQYNVKVPGPSWVIPAGPAQEGLGILLTPKWDNKGTASSKEIGCTGIRGTWSNRLSLSSASFNEIRGGSYTL